MKSIMYHYVRDANPQFPFFRYLSIENFRKQLDYFDAEFGFAKFDDFIGVINGSEDFSVIENKVVLTFDDGFTDHYDYVYPELLKRGLFGIFYIPTGVYSQNKPLDVHRIQYLMGKVAAKTLLEFIYPHILPHMLNDKEVEIFSVNTYRLQNNDKWTQEFKKVFNYYIKYEFRTSLLDLLVDEFSSDKEIFHNLYMSVKQLNEMQSNNMLIGSHSVNHKVFSKLSDSEQRSEIFDSFSYLVRELGEPKIRTFCYPYGGFHTFNDTTEELLDEVGCSFSFNVEQRNVSLFDFTNRRQALPRFDCNQFKHGHSSIGSFRPQYPNS
ncbi:MAG: polysaccharide deacetylase family protein [Alteromonadaceae bacterium]|nr:polysaccharide deacetylase family protein [Alteromonadaceae bacterium]